MKRSLAAPIGLVTYSVTSGVILGIIAFLLFQRTISPVVSFINVAIIIFSAVVVPIFAAALAYKIYRRFRDSAY